MIIELNLFFIDCFEEVPYDGAAIKITDPITNVKDAKFSYRRTAKSCQLLCQKEEKCNYFTWIGSTQITTQNSANTFRCFLKSEKDGDAEAEGGGDPRVQHLQEHSQRGADDAVPQRAPGLRDVHGQ